MIKRVLFLGFILTIVILFAFFNPIKAPLLTKDSRYLKLDTKGDTLKAWEGPWKCVEDQSSGLVWEVKSNQEDIHDEQSTFSWYDGKKGLEDGGDCFINDEYCDTLDIIETSNKQHLCGISSWRLPTKKELTTLLDYHPKPGNPLIDTSYFPYTRRGPYWTSNNAIPLFGIYKNYKEGAYCVNFSNAIVKTLPYSNTCFVRLVATKTTLSNSIK